jgi:hypothetical protein
MTDTTTRAVALAMANERLRQERETFDQRKEQDRRWFKLRMAMGWLAVVLLPLLAAAAFYVLYNNAEFTAATVTAAGAALFVDVVGLVISIWKVVLGQSPKTFEPVTEPAGYARGSLPDGRS